MYTVTKFYVHGHLGDLHPCTEIYEKTTGNSENSVFTGNSKIRFLKFYEKNKLLEFTGSDCKFSKSGNNNLGIHTLY